MARAALAAPVVRVDLAVRTRGLIARERAILDQTVRRAAKAVPEPKAKLARPVSIMLVGSALPVSAGR